MGAPRRRKEMRGAWSEKIVLEQGTDQDGRMGVRGAWSEKTVSGKQREKGGRWQGGESSP